MNEPNPIVGFGLAVLVLEICVILIIAVEIIR